MNDTQKIKQCMSSCLVGVPCRYNGKSKVYQKSCDIYLKGNTLLICPEIMAGLPTPRPACEIVGGDGADVLRGKAKIIDKDGNSIPNLPVTIHSDPQDTITDENGIATFKDIPAGEHTLIFAYQNKDFQKKIAIAEPQTDREVIQAEIITIKAEKDALPIWIVSLIFGLIVILLVVIFYKRKKA